MKKFIISAMALATLIFAASPEDAAARDRWDRDGHRGGYHENYGHRHGHGRGHGHRHPPPRHVYYHPAPVYYAPYPVYYRPYYRPHSYHGSSVIIRW